VVCCAEVAKIRVWPNWGPLLCDLLCDLANSRVRAVPSGLRASLADALPTTAVASTNTDTHKETRDENDTPMDRFPDRTGSGRDAFRSTRFGGGRQEQGQSGSQGTAGRAAG